MSWLAVRTENVDELLKKAGLKKTGEKTLILDAPITLGQMPSGWAVVAFDHEELTDRSRWLSDLSSGFDLFVGFVEEHVMVSKFGLWSEGRLVWEVSHTSEKGRFDLQVTGTPPKELVTIRDRLFSEQKDAGGEEADVDFIFDVPTRLSKALNGFKHDEQIEGFDDENCDVLVGSVLKADKPEKPAQQSKPSLFKRLFGG